MLAEPERIPDARAHVAALSRLDAAVLRTQANAALTELGWKSAIAHAVVAAAAAAQGPEMTLERLSFEALRRSYAEGVNVAERSRSLEHASG
jgi:hypothetical protein